MKLKVFLALLAGSVFAVGSAVSATDDRNSRVAIEGGLVNPGGNLGSAFGKADLSLGADTGYEVGFRLRLPLTQSLSVSPGFHFVDFKSHALNLTDDLEFLTESLSYRFTLEWMYAWVDARKFGRPFVAIAGGLYRNRVVGFYDDPTKEQRDDSVNTFGYSARAGLVVRGFEASVVVHRNEVDTRRYFLTGAVENYQWHQIGLRFGYLLPW
jgi:hypothetical protein